MKKMGFFWMGAAMSAMMGGPLHAQESEGNAELYQEEYTDEFQENFFEGLKQKGIGNQDRAIARFLKCKQLEPTNRAVDHELAKAFYLDQRYGEAQPYALAALRGAPDDYWVLDQLILILDRQGIPLEALGDQIPMENIGLRENLALHHFRSKKYREASKVLDGLKASPLKRELMRKIEDSLAQGNGGTTAPPKEKEREAVREGDGSPAALRTELEALISNGESQQLLERSQEALQLYPVQPYFYYAHGRALNDAGNPKKALEVLGEGLDYLVEDRALRNEIYRESARAHTLLGDPQKANEFLNKIDSGS